VPPADNLRSIVASGVDLVVFTGSKAIRGPTGSGFVAGRADLVASVMLQHQDWDIAVELNDARRDWLWGTGPPFVMGMGRAFKVGKEDIAGAVAALEAYATRDHDEDIRQWTKRLQSIQAGLCHLPGLQLELQPADESNPVPLLKVGTVSPAPAVQDLADDLRRRDPVVWLGLSLFPARQVWIDPVNLQEGDDELLVAAFTDVLRQR
jgi:D-glucosaminate-6-phosphate ammonia-lyase